MSRYRPERGPDPQTLWLVLGAGAVAGATAWALTRDGRNPVEIRPGDDAPGRTARDAGARTGRTVTIARPRAELYAFWRDLSNLPKFMENVAGVETGEGLSRWTFRGLGPLGLSLETRITEEVPDRLIGWESTASSSVRASGSVTFRDAPAGRGTEVEAVIAFVPPYGMGPFARLFRLAPGVRGTHELKRFKMLMEAGEIATSLNRKDH